VKENRRQITSLFRTQPVPRAPCLGRFLLPHSPMGEMGSSPKGFRVCTQLSDPKFRELKPFIRSKKQPCLTFALEGDIITLDSKHACALSSMTAGQQSAPGKVEVWNKEARQAPYIKGDGHWPCNPAVPSRKSSSRPCHTCGQGWDCPSSIFLGPESRSSHDIMGQTQ
jgi:hypothetical protein